VKENIYSVIAGTGSFIPENIVQNNDFLQNTFYDQEKNAIATPNEDLISKFRQITNIDERRYADDNMVTSDMAYLAAKNALNSSGIDPETLDGIIVAHNFGDVRKANMKSDMVPSLASRVKCKLAIKNPDTTAFDLVFGCPGWLQGIIMADYQIKSGDAKRIMVIGAEMLSRVSDPHDRDSMIYSDGAGATILEAKYSSVPIGILSHATRTDAMNEAHYLEMKESYNPNYEGQEIYLKMLGRKLYEYALNYVPQLVKKCLEKADLTLDNINKVLIHQANEKMDDAILHRIFKLYGFPKIRKNVMPMTINKLGNSSVATLPTLLDLIIKGKLDNHILNENDHVVFASVGAGMNINAVAYKF
jgi:3-oxoacyl-[acyl-carrier-protein] synthase III